MITFWILFLMSFAGTFYVMPHSIRKLREGGYVASDMYKTEKPFLPTNAGIIVLFTSFISISLLPLIVRALNQVVAVEESTFNISMTNMALLSVVSIYALYGLVDDLLDIGRTMKLFLPITFGYPLISVIRPEFVWIPGLGNFDLTVIAFGTVPWSDLFRVTIIPVYVMVVSNLVNMHSGYNGLQSGLSIILISTLLVKSWRDGVLDSVLIASAFLGAMVAFWWFNKYPSQVFEGNVGSLLFGSVIGCVIVVQQYWWFGFFILVPHSLNFILWLYWLFMIKKSPEIYLESDGLHKKFGAVMDDNTIEAPNFLTFKWIPNYFFNLTELQSVLTCYLITGLFCITGLIIF